MRLGVSALLITTAWLDFANPVPVLLSQIPDKFTADPCLHVEKQVLAGLAEVIE